MGNSKEIKGDGVQDFYELMKVRDKQELAAVISCNEKIGRASCRERVLTSV